MLRSIRNQILVPLVAVQGMAVATLTVTAATLAARRSERQIVGRLNDVIDTLGHANFPYTPSVLTKMRGLSGAHFAVYDEDGRATDTTLPALYSRAAWLPAGRPMTRLESLGHSATMVLDGTRYFTVPLRTGGGSRGSTLLVLYPETSWRQARWEATTSPLAVGLGTLALMMALTSWIAHRISGRIHRLRQQVALIAAGDFEEFDPGPTQDEVRDLAGAINGMSAQLREMQRTIRQSERARLLAQLAAGLAHQLRNSLTGARMSVQLHAKRFPPQGGDETLKVALRQLAITEEQVRGLLSLGRVERQPYSLCDLGKLLGDIALLVHPSCEHAGVALRVRGEVEGFHVVAEEASLRAAILNLTLNAIEAAGPGGQVDVGISNGNDEVAIEVSDDGPGPPPEVAESLLEAFVTTKPGGVGLGLAIAQQVATEHGGRLSWGRESGQTRFRLALPRGNGMPKENR